MSRLSALSQVGHNSLILTVLAPVLACGGRSGLDGDPIGSSDASGGGTVVTTLQAGASSAQGGQTGAGVSRPIGGSSSTGGMSATGGTGATCACPADETQVANSAPCDCDGLACTYSHDYSSSCPAGCTMTVYNWVRCQAGVWVPGGASPGVCLC